MQTDVRVEMSFGDWLVVRTTIERALMRREVDGPLGRILERALAKVDAALYPRTKGKA